MLNDKQTSIKENPAHTSNEPATVFHVYYENTLVADITYSKTEILLKKYVDSTRVVQPFKHDYVTYKEFYAFLKDRCYEDSRVNLPDILASVGITKNNPFEWARLTHGVTVHDHFWIAFDDENITWEDVRL